MSYTNKIFLLQESLKLIEKRINSVDKTADNNLLSEIINQKVIIEREISRLQKLDWEEKHERVNLDDER